MKTRPVLDLPDEVCSSCGHNGSPYFGNVAPHHLMNYLLQEHAVYLFEAILNNIFYLNKANYRNDEFLLVKKRDTGEGK